MQQFCIHEDVFIVLYCRHACSSQHRALRFFLKKQCNLRKFQQYIFPKHTLLHNFSQILQHCAAFNDVLLQVSLLKRLRKTARCLLRTKFLEYNAIVLSIEWINGKIVQYFSIFFNDFSLIFFLCLTNMMYRPKRIFLCVGFGGISVRSTIYSKNILDRYFVGAVIRNAFVANNAIFFSRSGQSTHKILTYIACLVRRITILLQI